MRRRITRALVAAAAAGATIGSLSFAATGSASAAEMTPVFTTNSAGWAAGNVLTPTVLKSGSNWNFRYAQSTTTVPAAAAPTNSTVAFTVMLANRASANTAQLYWNGTAWAVSFSQYYSNAATAVRGTCTATFTPGTQVTLSVFYNQSDGTISWSAANGPTQVCQGSTSAWVAASVGGGSFSEAFAGATYPLAIPGTTAATGSPYTTATTFTRPAADAKVFPITGTHFTSYNGTKGTVIGGWDYQQVINGTSSASTTSINANAPVLWNGGENFAVWERAL
jgi:hypothetical protein